jgi:hypothetical protein
MKVRILPLYFDPGRDGGFDKQLSSLRALLGTDVDLLAPQALGSALPEADAVLFPQFLGEGYRRLEDFKKIRVPILVITSEYGTISMWDWELIAFLRESGVATIAPYSLLQTKHVISALRVRRELTRTKFVVYQDNPGQGQQAPIFKRFFWWESECTERMVKKFGITIEKRSFKELGAAAKAIPDSEAEKARKGWTTPMESVSPKGANSATKLYLALRREIEADPNIRAVGVNCLNESHFSDTTPCLAWSRLYGDLGLIWGCEGDTVSMLTKYILHKSLGAPILMTNLYPFLLGDAALKHERIDKFPQVTGDPKDYILIAHCGYMGVIPEAYASDWKLRPKVLSIVDDNATAIDARLPVGPITIAKLQPSFERITVAEGVLEGYAQYPNSDCRNGGIVRVRDGNALMTKLSSHHQLLMIGHQQAEIELIAPIFGLGPEII